MSKIYDNLENEVDKEVSALKTAIKVLQEELKHLEEFQNNIKRVRSEFGNYNYGMVLEDAMKKYKHDGGDE